MTLTFDPLTLKVCGRSGVSSASLVQFGIRTPEIYSGIWAQVKHLTAENVLNRLWYIWWHVLIVCTKFDRNRTIPAEVFTIWQIFARIISL